MPVLLRSVFWSYRRRNSSSSRAQLVLILLALQGLLRMIFDSSLHETNGRNELGNSLQIGLACTTATSLLLQHSGGKALFVSSVSWCSVRSAWVFDGLIERVWDMFMCHFVHPMCFFVLVYWLTSKLLSLSLIQGAWTLRLERGHTNWHMLSSYWAYLLLDWASQSLEHVLLKELGKEGLWLEMETAFIATNLVKAVPAVHHLGSMHGEFHPFHMQRCIAVKTASDFSFSSRTSSLCKNCLRFTW